MNNELMATYMMITFLVVLPLTFSFAICIAVIIGYYKKIKRIYGQVEGFWSKVWLKLFERG